MDAIHLVCPHCSTINRVSKARISEQPHCGKCKHALFNGHPTEVNTPKFERHINNNDIAVVVDFWASWCGPCQMMAPAYQQAAEKLEPFYRLLKVNTETEQGLAGQYAIRSIPTLAIFRHGKEIVRQSGAMTVNDIVRWVQHNARH